MSLVQKNSIVAAPGTVPRAVDSELLPAALISPKRFLVVLAALFALHIVIRLITSPVADLDESEQLVFTQSFAWGYGPQPPLYTWLQVAFFRVFGPSLFALSLLKNILIFGIYAFTYAAARRLARSHFVGVIAALALMFIPQIVWESQRDLTHSVLATTFAAATLYVFAQLADGGRRAVFYPLLGACFGLGMLSNYNYALLAVGLVVGAVFVKEFRALVLTPWMLLSIAIGLVIILPHWLWAREHVPVVLASIRKMRIRSTATVISITSASIHNLVWAWLTHVMSIIIVFAVLCWKQLVPFPRAAFRRAPAMLMLAIVTAALAGVAFMMIGKHATAFKGRWLQPIYVCLPMFFALLVEPRLNRSVLRQITFLAGTVTLIVIVLLPARIWYAEPLHRDEPLRAPLPELTSMLKQSVAQSDFIVTSDFFLGGNFRLSFPQKKVFTPEFNPSPLRQNGSSCLIIYNATEDLQPPPAFHKFLAGEIGSDAASIEWSFIQTRSGATSKALRLAYARVVLK